MSLSAECRLNTQPPGPVILLGHSMGGLLAADAATDVSNAQRKRIAGMVAFDTPYLGMHPHVMITGIASLFPKDDDNERDGHDSKNHKPSEGKKEKTESEMNDHSEVQMVDREVTDDWEAFKRELDGTSNATS